jgi:hypothetical protein
MRNLKKKRNQAFKKAVNLRDAEDNLLIKTQIQNLKISLPMGIIT